MNKYDLIQEYNKDTVIGQTINIAMNVLVDNILNDDIAISNKHIHILSKITKNTTLRWKLFLESVYVQCPYCNNILSSDCGLFMCYRCDEISKVNSPLLLDICTDCSMYNVTCACTKPNDKYEEPIIIEQRTFKPIIGQRNDR